MKKFITLFGLIALFFIGIQQTQAQDTNRIVEAEMPEAIAKKQTFDIHQAANLTTEQQHETFKVLVDLQKSYKDLSESNDDLDAVERAKGPLLEKANGLLKNILTEEQFAMYLKSLEIK
jgi:hypothetical protein